MKQKNKKSSSKFREVVINDCYGGFGISHEAVIRYAELKGLSLTVKTTGNSLAQYAYSLSDELNTGFYPHDIPRDDVCLVKTIKELKEKSHTRFSKLKIVKIPRDVKWHIEEYDGMEHIAEDHRTWS